MKRPFIFITMLMCLFMFQSVWNIAAAFCEHEKIDNAIHQPHFGHHELSETCQQEHQQTEHTHDDGEIHSLNLQDHHDHLLNFNHILVIDVQSEIIIPHRYSVATPQKYFWFNLYQSPDLTGLTPPPLFTPLLVG